MKFRGTLSWILVLLALGGYVFFVEFPSEKKAQEEKVLAEKLLHFKEPEVEAVEIEYNGTLTRVVRTESGSWKLEQPVKDNADGSTIDQLIYELENAKFNRVVDPDPKDVSGYGLESPSLALTVHLKDKSAQKMEVGDPSPIGESRYVRSEGQKRVVMAEIEYPLFAKSGNDLRDRTLLDFQTNDIDMIKVRYNNEEQTLTRKDREWTLSGTVNGKADPDEVTNFLGQIQSAYILTFKEEQAKDLKPYGLDAPKIEFTATSTAKNKSWTLRIGSTEDNKRHFAQRTSEGNVFTIGNPPVSALSRNFITFLDKRLFDFKDNDVAQITIEHGTEVVQLKQDEENKTWRIVQPKPSEVDAVTVNSMLFDLKDVRVAEFIKVEDLSLFGMDTPQKKLTLKLKSGGQQVVELGNSNASQDLYFAQRGRDKAQFVVTARTVKKIFRTLHDLKDKHLVSIDENRIHNILLAYPDTTFELERREKGWSLVQPETMETIPDHISKDIFWTLNNLEYEAQFDPDHKPQQTGIDKPQLKITLRGKQKQTIGWITVGKAVESTNLLFAEVDSRSSTFHIKKRFLDEMPKTLEPFQTKSP